MSSITQHATVALLLAASAAAQTGSFRFATYNSFLNRSTSGALIADLSTPGNTQVAAVAEVLQRARPDVVLLNEFDYDAGAVALDLFRQNYLSVSQNGADPID